jgi:D-tagatose-1,6-bisphosphate aldolase subunit GatZ/KbaZ
MKSIRSIIKHNIELRHRNNLELTLLAVCPNSESVLAAAVKAASTQKSVMLFAATLNQVDYDGGYTGWTPQQFVRKIRYYADHYDCDSYLYPCLDHGGPWLKDKDTLKELTFAQTFENVKKSIEFCIKAGYTLLHIDPTVDRTFPPEEPIPVELVVNRTVELISYAEKVRERHQLPEISYEVGTEEVHGGMVDLGNFERFISLLMDDMAENNLLHIWPCFFVAQVGTDLHTMQFNKGASQKIYELLYPTGALAKGHYTDWVSNPADYPKSGMGGANIGPEFTSEEFIALMDFEKIEENMINKGENIKPSKLLENITNAVIQSNRWQKWLLADEKGLDFNSLTPERKLWLLQTGSRYIWTNPAVLSARENLYKNVSGILSDPNEFVVDRIVKSIDRYLQSFNLVNSHYLYNE